MFIKRFVTLSVFHNGKIDNLKYLAGAVIPRFTEGAISPIDPKNRKIHMC